MSAPDAPSGTNSTDGYDPFSYAPDAPVPYWHQDLELAFICIFNAMTFMLIVTRVTIRRLRLGRFRKDDIWMMAAGVILLLYWASQVGTNRFGSGLHQWNAPDAWLPPFFYFETGWVGYYIVASMIKVSVLYGLLEILPLAFQKLRTFVYVLCIAISALGVAETLVWIFQCQPFLSNFVYSVPQEWCLNIDAARYSWVGVSVFFDLCIVTIPFTIIRQIRLKSYERLVLFAVFGANLLGTFACAFGAYGIWVNNNDAALVDDSYTESIFIMTGNVELFLYTLGASATMASRYFISKAESYSRNSGSGSRGSDWRSEISWPMSNESYYTHTAPSKPARTRSQNSSRTFGSFGLKRGFKGADVEILENFDLQESPSRSARVGTPRSGHALLGSRQHTEKGAISVSPSIPESCLESPLPAGTPDLMDVGGLMESPPRATPLRQQTTPLPQARKASGGRANVPFSPVNWTHRGSHSPTFDLVPAQPWEGQGPIDGWTSRR